jgi:PTH1 family peptidyl-tRNA hydrolase
MRNGPSIRYFDRLNGHSGRTVLPAVNKLEIQGNPAMQIWTGLGNPGPQYAMHRHNIGFMAVDAIAAVHNFSPPKRAFQGWVQEGRIGAHKLLLLKPGTWMNESGRSVGEAMRFYKLDPADVTVFHDELDLAPFKLKVKTGGGHAGHNGLRSTDQHIGPDFRRIRLGIGHPGHKDRVTPYVLGNFAKVELDDLTDLLGAIAAEAPWLAAGDDVRFMNEIARRMA